MTSQARKPSAKRERGTHNERNARSVIKLQRQQAALELRRSGLSYSEIAHRIGIGKTTAHRLIEDAIREASATINDEAREMKALELSRLDGMLAGLWTDARRGNVQAVDRVLKIMERRAKLLGLDAPVKVASTTPAGDEDPTRYVVPVPAMMTIDEWARRFDAAGAHPKEIAP